MRVSALATRTAMMLVLSKYEGKGLCTLRAGLHPTLVGWPLGGAEFR